MPGQENIETILCPGQLVGTQYRVERLIAKGGMAAVWEGVNEHTGKRVALKVILQSFTSNRDAVELFRREALSASKINHPNVVNIFDVINHAGMTCIVMELLDGETLASYLTRTGPISLEKTLSLLLPAMRGVAAANAQGVVHRDLKPANIFLCCGSDGQLITTKVLDFGISVIIRQAGETAPAPQPFSMFGTPAYMAPEALESSLDLDGRADVYGFGVLFFEALTGKLPFPGPPGMELFKHILTDPPPKVTVYRSDLPIDVVNLIDCALAKNREDRFADMDHLIHATEDRLLPLLPSPSALIKLSGISVLPPAPALAESAIGAPVPVVHAVFEKEGSALSHLASTRVLYSMPTASSHMRSQPKQVSIPNPRRVLKRRAAVRFSISACLVVTTFLVVTAWAPIPATSNDRGVGHDQSARGSEIAPRAQRPQVVPLPSPPEPAPVSDVPPVPSEVVEVVDETRTLVSPPESQPAKHASRPESWKPEQRSTSLPDQPTAPRAGRLYPSDF